MLSVSDIFVHRGNWWKSADYADYGDMVEIKTGRRVVMWWTFCFGNPEMFSLR